MSKPRVKTAHKEQVFSLEVIEPSEEEKAEGKLQFEHNLEKAAKRLRQVVEAEMGQPAQLIMPHNSSMSGFVKDGHFHVYDTVTTGPSFRELTGERPNYGPIPLEKINRMAAVGHVLRYLD